MQRACTVCGAPSNGSRCELHPAKRSPSSRATSQRRHKDRRARMIESALAGGVDCPLCEKRIGLADAIDVDHITPLGAGGTDDEWNLRLTHASCNRSKGASA